MCAARDTTTILWRISPNEIGLCCKSATMNHTLRHADWTLQWEWAWDAMVALDYAATLADVDMDRVAVCGLSTGAHLSMNVLALDARVKAGVVGCILSTWNHYERRFRIPPHCDCGIHAQLGGILAQCDWAALAAPKPVMFQHGFRTPHSVPVWMKKISAWSGTRVSCPAPNTTRYSQKLSGPDDWRHPRNQRPKCRRMFTMVHTEWTTRPLLRG